MGRGGVLLLPSSLFGGSGAGMCGENPLGVRGADFEAGLGGRRLHIAGLSHERRLDEAVEACACAFRVCDVCVSLRVCACVCDICVCVVCERERGRERVSE